MRHLERKQNGSDVETMMKAMKHVEEPFTLVFRHEYTDKSVTECGSDALKGEDRGWFLNLQDANTRLSETHKLQFYIAKVKYEINYYDGSGAEFIEHCKWEEDERHQRGAKWYLTDGTPLESESPSEFALNLLNPDHLTLKELWGRSGITYKGYMGNESATKSFKYSRYTLIAWPLSQDTGFRFQHINSDAAIASLQAERPLTSSRLESFMAHVIKKHSSRMPSYRPDYYYSSSSSAWLSTQLASTIAELLEETHDVALVCLFFDKLVLFQRKKHELGE